MSELEPVKPSQANIDKMWNYAHKYAEKSGTHLHPDVSVTEAVVVGLASHVELVGRPICPCNFYPDPQAEAKRRRWICACDEMQKFKYCHCLLFVTADGLPITEYLPEDHEGARPTVSSRTPTPTRDGPPRASWSGRRPRAPASSAGHRPHVARQFRSGVDV